MKFSVIIPCHNAGEWVRDTLVSVSEQSYPPHEIIVINDGSTDDSVEQIQASGVPVRLLHTRCGSPAGARNAGIEVATGDWIAFLDADDTWYPDHLERAVKAMRGRDDVGYMSMFDRLEGGTVVYRDNAWPIKELTGGLTHHRFIDCWQANLRFYMITSIVRRDRVNEVGRFDESLLRREDFELWLRVIHDHAWTFNPVATACARHDNPNSNSRESWANACYFMLVAMLKNTEAYSDTPYMDIVRYAAKQAMSVALLSGTRKDRINARGVSWPYISPVHKLIFRLADLCPSGYRLIHRVRQKMKRPSYRPA